MSHKLLALILCSYICYAHSIRVVEIQAAGNQTSWSAVATGYVRNYNPHGSASDLQLTPSDSSSDYFCNEFQRFPHQATGWPRLKVPPASTIRPRYSLSKLPHPNGTGVSSNGVVHWYGTNVHMSPDTRTFTDVLSFNNGTDGQLLAVHSYNDVVAGNYSSFFTIPSYPEVDSTYTLYWMWNTTTTIDKQWLVYTACMDIDIETQSEAKMSSQLTARTSTSSFSSIAVTVPAAQRSQVSLTIDISPELPEGANEPTCTLHAPPELGPSPITTTTKLSTEPTGHMHGALVMNPTKFHSPSSRRPSGLGLPMSRPQFPAQSPTVSGLMHRVEVNFNNGTSFNRSHLDDIPIGDSVMFWFNGLFNLYNTTFDHPCAIKNKVQRTPWNPMYILPVTTTDPVWFFACPVGEDCYCDRNAHFALNAGPLREQYFNNAAATAVVIKTTTLQEDVRTVYTTTTVTLS